MCVCAGLGGWENHLHGCPELSLQLGHHLVGDAVPPFGIPYGALGHRCLPGAGARRSRPSFGATGGHPGKGQKCQQKAEVSNQQP